MPRNAKGTVMRTDQSIAATARTRFFEKAHVVTQATGNNLLIGAEVGTFPR